MVSQHDDGHMTNGTMMTPPLRVPDDSIAESAGATIQRHLPGDGHIWLFVIGDMVIFSAYFTVYMFDRGQNHELFLQSQQHLSRNLGALNTLMLLTSSLFVALSVQAARAGDLGIATRFLTLGGICGAGFVLIKAFEWYLKVSAGITISTNGFFMHYYMMTGLHFFHVLLGLVILAICWRELHGATLPRVKLLEIGATYWHMVDYLWILIFALLYLMR
jgi:nitric oxide reductase NorE protein